MNRFALTVSIFKRCQCNDRLYDNLNDKRMKIILLDRYNREEVVASLGREINLNPPLTLGQLPDTTEELLKLDQVTN